MILKLLRITFAIGTGVAVFFGALTLVSFLYPTSQRKPDKITSGYLEVANYQTAQYEPLIRLLDERGFFYCSGVVIDGQYALTAAHCVKGTFGFITNDKIIIHEEHDGATGTIAEAVALDDLRDIALIKGDFRNFKSMNVEYYSAKAVEFPNRMVVACGFPSGGPTYCSIGIIQANEYFKIRTKGSMIYKGMSGGAVVDILTGAVVGVNSAATEDGELVAPVVGAFELFGI